MTDPSATGSWPERWPYSGRRDPVAGRDAMVATTDLLATRVGARILGEGGNAVDAAIAVSFALAVVNPEAGNVGGGGYLLVRRADGTTDALDYRSAAPAAATRDMFRDPHAAAGSEAGRRAVAVPGAVQGLWQAHRRHGRLAWDSLVQPSVVLASGFPVGERLVRSFTPPIVEGLSRFEATRAVFLASGGRPPRSGDMFRQPDLGRTLERIRDHGADGFYRGVTADLIVAELSHGGGLLTHEDLESYRPVWRQPIRFGYREHHVLSMPPSSSGGLTLSATASILEAFPLSDLAWHGADHVHLLAEAWRRAFADRNHYLADPAFTDLPGDTLLSPGYGRWRAAGVAPDRATPSTDVGPGVASYGGHTTHVSIVDPTGTAVSLTTTLNTWFGSKLMAEGTGVLLNNEMDDFTTRPGIPNHFGLIQGDANAIQPGKRPLSAMTPTIVLDPEERLLLVVGSPGGATIITTVFQVVSNIVDHGMDLSRAVRAPRVHHQHLPDRIECEPGGLTAHVSSRLRAIGHRVEERVEPIGDVQAVLVAPDGSLLGESDPRRGGAALGA